MAEAAPRTTFEHPSLKEGFTDKVYRYVNEMVLYLVVFHIDD